MKVTLHLPQNPALLNETTHVFRSKTRIEQDLFFPQKLRLCLLRLAGVVSACCKSHAFSSLASIKMISNKGNINPRKEDDRPVTTPWYD